MHVLVLGDRPHFYRGQQTAILGKIFDKVLNWWLTENGKSKTIGFITDYMTILYIHPKFGGGRLNGHGETAEIGVG